MAEIWLKTIAQQKKNRYTFFLQSVSPVPPLKCIIILVWNSFDKYFQVKSVLMPLLIIERVNVRHCDNGKII